jgi:GT2 family glycosyltransferase
MASDATIAVCTYESDPALLLRVLDAASAQSERPLLVVDMSRGGGVEGAVRGRRDVAYVPFRGSSGLSASRNECMRRADSRHLIFIDSDALPEEGWAAAMTGALDRGGVAVAGARVLPPRDLAARPLLLSATASDWLSLFDLGPESREVPRVVGTSFAVDLERTAGLRFDEEIGYGPGRGISHEEVRFCLEVRRSGWRCWYAAEATVRHCFDPSRITWRAMLRRAYRAGAESRLEGERLEPLPRRMTARDHVFRALVAPAFLAGRLRGPGHSAADT